MLHIFKMFTWGGILSDIRSEIWFKGYAGAELLNVLSKRLSDNIAPQMNVFEYIYPLHILMQSFSVVSQIGAFKAA